MRVATTITIVGAVILILAVGVFLRVDAPQDLPPPQRVDAPPDSLAATPRSLSPRDHSPQVAKRLERLRRHSEERQRRELIVREPTPEARALPQPLRPQAKTVDEVDADDVAYLEQMKAAALSDPDPSERAAAVVEIAGEDDRDVLRVLLQALRDPEPEVRMAVVEALVDYTDELQPHVLLPALEDPDPEIRFEALGILGDMETPEARAFVQRALTDPDEDVRELAEGILELDAVE